ncbi:MAG: sulfatase [Actinomycetota bacterium]|nr:sulfatase [Actinomycetota bacterium]
MTTLTTTRTAAAAALLSLALLAYLLWAGSPEALRAAGDNDATRPNVVVVMTDDQTVESMRVMPKVQALLAEKGITFANSFASNPVCCPSRGTFLTGRYAHNTGVLRNSAPNGGFDALDSSETLPVWLQRAGYWTGHIGKYLNGYGQRGDGAAAGVPPGWSEWYGTEDPTTYRMYGYTLNENGTQVTYGDYDIADPATYQTDVFATKAVDFIDRRAPGDVPFFLSVAPLAPHVEVFRRASPGDDDPPTPLFPNPRPAPRHTDAFADENLRKQGAYDEANVNDKPAAIRALPPLDGPASGQARNKYRSRLTSLLAVDDMVGEIVNALRINGELDDTLVIFTSDNGFLLGEHRIRTGKQYPYEPSIRVPLVVRGPDLPKGEIREQLAANVDLAPTILDYANAEPGVAPDGRSLRRLINDPLLEPGRSIALENWCQVEETACFDPLVARYRGVRTNRYAYMEYPSGERELYDLVKDPDQLKSRHASTKYDAEERALHLLLERMQACAAAGCQLKPGLKLKLAYDVSRVGGRPSGKRCTASPVEATIGGRDAGEAVSARFFIPDDDITDEGRPLRTRIKRSALNQGQATPLSAHVSVRDGRLVSAAGGSVPRAC